MATGLSKWWDFALGRRSRAESAAVPNYRRRGVLSDESKRARRLSKVQAPRLESIGQEIVPGPRLTPASSWVCQYQEIKPEAIAGSGADAVVLDTSKDGSRETFFTPAELDTMRAGKARKLIGYMSIGEAEYCRFYWRENWLSNGEKTGAAPAWLNRPNEDNWAGNWTVRFWDPAWQDIIINRPDSFLNRIIDHGFDGVFLDIIDAYIYWMNSDRGAARRPTAASEMVTFVRRIAEHARVKRGKPDFAVVPINGEQLLKFPEFCAAISAIGKEDVFYEQVGKANQKPRIKARDEAEIEEIVSHLRLAIANRIPVLSMEYLRDWPEDAAKVAPLLARLRSLGYVPYFCKRNLADLSKVTLPEAVA